MFPEYNPENPELLESIVCFTDILGFSNECTTLRENSL